MRLLEYNKIALESAFHAALVVGEGAGFQVSVHGHDFYELMWILEGQALQQVNGDKLRLKRGDLQVLTPQDRHWVRFEPGFSLRYINIAFPAVACEEFLRASGLPPLVGHHRSVDTAKTAHLDFLFEQALQSFGISLCTSRLELCQLLTGLFTTLRATPPAESGTRLTQESPHWLQAACLALLQEPDGLCHGLELLQARAEVSAGYLARTLKAATGKSPTEYINALRLERAAQLLATTNREIAEIALVCGFTQLSYFYRLFKARWGQSPRAYRLSARQHIAP